jgi:flavodoxin
LRAVRKPLATAHARGSLERRARAGGRGAPLAGHRGMRILVVYYSRSGTTRDLASAIARTLGADVEALVDDTPRSGRLGYLRCGLDSLLERDAPIRPATKDPRDYDLVVVGTPVWAANVSSPVRAYLHAMRGRLTRVAFFCTMGGSGDARVFRKMEALCGASVVARLAQRERALWKPAEAAILSFAAAVKAAAPPAPAPPERRAAAAAA